MLPFCHQLALDHPPLAHSTWTQWLTVDAASAWCGLCGGPFRAETLVIDHCHRTGLERGFLCRACNVREGVRRGALWRAYRERPPSLICQDMQSYWAAFPAGFREPQQWVVSALGPLPSDAAARVVYFVSAAHLNEPTPDDPFADYPLRGLFE